MNTINEEVLIRRAGRVVITHKRTGVSEVIMRVNGREVCGGIGLSKITAMQDMLSTFKRECTSVEFLSQWPKLEEPTVPYILPTMQHAPVPVHSGRDRAGKFAVDPRKRPIGVSTHRLGDGAPREKNYGRGDLKTRQRLMAEKRHPNRAVVKAVRAAASASSN